MRFTRLGWSIGAAISSIGVIACSDDDSIPQLTWQSSPDAGRGDAAAVWVTDDTTEAGSSRSETSGETSAAGVTSDRVTSSDRSGTDVTPSGTGTQDGTSTSQVSTSALETTDVSSGQLVTSEATSDVATSSSDDVASSSSEATSSDVTSDAGVVGATSAHESSTFGSTTSGDATSDASWDDASVPDAATDGVTSDDTDISAGPCGAAAPPPILGDYLTSSGDEVWLRDSGRGVILTRVPSGPPQATRLPELWEVVRGCSLMPTFVVRSEDATFTRVDWRRDADATFLCIADASTQTPEAAFALDAADPTAPADFGCNGGAWLNLTLGGN